MMMIQEDHPARLTDIQMTVAVSEYAISRDRQQVGAYLLHTAQVIEDQMIDDAPDPNPPGTRWPKHGGGYRRGAKPQGERQSHKVSGRMRGNAATATPASLGAQSACVPHMG